MIYYPGYENGKRPDYKKHSSQKHIRPHIINRNKTSRDTILNMRISNLMKKYKNDPDILEELKNKANMFVMNVTIAKNLGTKQQEKKLYKEFNNYLNTL